MSKRILSQSLKHPKQRWKENLVDQSSAWTKIRDVVVTLGAISGVITGVLWLGGRFYAFGYFGRMAVPIYFLNFPFGEYAENYIIYTFSDIIAFFASHWLLLLITIVIGVALAILLIWYFRKQYTKEAIRATILRIENWNNRVLGYEGT